MRPADEYIETAEWEIFGAATTGMLLASGEPEPEDIEYTLEAMKKQLERAENAMKRYRVASSEWPRAYRRPFVWWKDIPC